MWTSTINIDHSDPFQMLKPSFTWFLIEISRFKPKFHSKLLVVITQKYHVIIFSAKSVLWQVTLHHFLDIRVRFSMSHFSCQQQFSIQKVLLYVLNRVSPKRIRGPKYHDTSLHGIFWFVYSSLVQQSTGVVII